MLAELRMETILAELNKEQAVSVAQLCQLTGAPFARSSGARNPIWM